MPPESYGNDANTLLNGAITNVATAVTVDSSAVFPAVPFRALIQDSISSATNREYVLVTAKPTGTSLTVTRAQEGTAGVAHGDNSYICAILTAAGLMHAVQENLVVGAANLLRNSSFENSDTANWTVGVNWEFGAGSLDTPSGSREARLIETAYAGVDDDLVSPEVSVDITEDYWVSVWVFVRTRTAGTFEIVLRCKNVGGTVLSSITVASLAVAGTGWTRLAVRMGPDTQYGRTLWPATTTKVDIVARASGTATLDASTDAWQIEKGDLLTAYAPAPYEVADGSVQGDHIAGGAITEVHLRDDSVTGPKIATGAVGTANLAADAVTGEKIADASILNAHISPVGLDAALLTSGVLSVGATEGNPSTLVVYDSLGAEIGRWSALGLVISDAHNPELLLRMTNGELEYSNDAGVTYLPAMSGEGLNAGALRVGHLPGAANRIPNAGFEMGAFATALTKVWTSAADWGTTIGTDVNVTKTGTELVMTTATY